MIPGVTLRAGTPDDVADIARMLEPAYRVKRSEDFYVWQFFRNANPCVLICAFTGSQLAGMFGIQRRVTVGGVVCGQASWINIDRRWRGQGLLHEMGREAMNYFGDLDAIFVFANAAARGPCEHALGLKTIGTIRTMILDVTASGSTGAPTACETINLASVFSTAKRSDDRACFRFQYDRAFRHWRYAQNPGYRYLRVVLDGGEYAVVKTFVDPSSNVRYGDIVDVECPLNDGRALAALIGKSIACLADHGAQRIAIWATAGSQLRSTVESMGFCEGNHETYFGLKVLSKKGDGLSDLGKWHLQQADATNY